MYTPGKVIRYFSIEMKLPETAEPRSLRQTISFTGVKGEVFLTISREPKPQGLYFTTAIHMYVL